MFTDRKSFYQSQEVNNNKEKDFLDTDVEKMSFVNYTQFVVPQFCEGRMDLISYIHYETVNLWWLIAHVNNIMDPITDLEAGMVLKIPSVSEAFEFYNKHAKPDQITKTFKLREIDV